MKIFSMIKTSKYGAVALISSVLMLLIYPFLQVVLNGGFYNYFFWFEMILSQSVLNFVLYLLFSGLFGIVVSLVYHNYRKGTCNVRRGAGSGGAGSLLAILIPQCSACLSLAVLFLPIGAVAMFGTYSTVLNLISLGLLVLSIHLLGGFEKA